MAELTIYEKKVSIPTYGVGEQNKNPMFLEKRVYQGSSGKVYPYPITDSICDEKREKEYGMVFIENEYLQIQIMPEIGGRIYRALDKTNNYDFVYYNRVIKPALVGLTGPWISGGIEFNWPQHHRPNTFGPVEYALDDSHDDYKALWFSERDRLYGTRASTAITLRKGSAVIEIHTELYNPTSEPQSFLWWANPAVPVHDETQSIFPPDVHAVMDHGKRDVSRFPIATGVYYKMDYSRGVDISRYKNIKVPTSYMAYASKYDFVGGYDYRLDTGILHVADHHISPGKKQWTWGCGEFGKAWDRNLTDEDGPYVELMTGVYTDNQPDFTWIAPYERKNFTQYFLPYKKAGMVKNANKDLVLGMKREDDKVSVTVYASKYIAAAAVRIYAEEEILFEDSMVLSPMDIYKKTIILSSNSGTLTVRLEAAGIAPLVYREETETLEPLPDPARAPGNPKDILNNEGLYLAGLHLEQYRHATYEPDAYYMEGLIRDPLDIRINNAYGNLLFRRGDFSGALSCFEAAKKSITRHNPNPERGEVFYNLGKAKEALGEEDAAFDAYYKAAWSGDYKGKAYLKLAQISCRRKRYSAALEFAWDSLYEGWWNFKARNILVIVSRILGDEKRSQEVLQETLRADPLDFVACYEMAKAEGMRNNPSSLKKSYRHILRNDPRNYIFLAASYAELGFYDESITIIKQYLYTAHSAYALCFYYLAFWLEQNNDPGAQTAWKDAARADSSYCFPNTLEDWQVLCRAVAANPADSFAWYYAGCFLYDKKRHHEAAAMWEKSCLLKADFPTAHRNLALYYANKQHDYVRAETELETAFNLDKTDARVFYELSELHKKTGMSLEDQKRLYERHHDIVIKRDDLAVSYIELLNALGYYHQALDILRSRNFHPWEGGEGKVPAQHREARIGIARALIKEEKYEEAVSELEKAAVYYDNFGEGKLPNTRENNIYYYMGLALQHIDSDRSRKCFIKASEGESEPSDPMYYNDQPPYMIYYQGLALRALGDEDGARSRFNKLVAYGETNLFKKQTMDYFAVSLPDFLVFDADLDNNNQIHCYYMMALGYMGLGDKEKARATFQNALNLCPNHYGVLRHMKDL
jgi:tetratricopeptide (TPR) repeat protein